MLISTYFYGFLGILVVVAVEPHVDKVGSQVVVMELLSRVFQNMGLESS